MVNVIIMENNMPKEKKSINEKLNIKNPYDYQGEYRLWEAFYYGEKACTKAVMKQNKKDLNFLKEIKEKIACPEDLNELDYVSTMVDDWINELEALLDKQKE